MPEKKINVKELKAEAAEKDLTELKERHADPVVSSPIQQHIDSIEADLAEVHGEFLKDGTLDRYSAQEIAEIEQLILEGRVTNKRFQDYRGAVCLVDSEPQKPGFGDNVVAKAEMINGKMTEKQKIGEF